MHSTTRGKRRLRRGGVRQVWQIAENGPHAAFCGPPLTRMRTLSSEDFLKLTEVQNVLNSWSSGLARGIAQGRCMHKFSPVVRVCSTAVRPVRIVNRCVLAPASVLSTPPPLSTGCFSTIASLRAAPEVWCVVRVCGVCGEGVRGSRQGSQVPVPVSFPCHLNILPPVPHLVHPLPLHQRRHPAKHRAGSPHHHHKRPGQPKAIKAPSPAPNSAKRRRKPKPASPWSPPSGVMSETKEIKVVDAEGVERDVVPITFSREELELYALLKEFISTVPDVKDTTVRVAGSTFQMSTPREARAFSSSRLP